LHVSEGSEFCASKKREKRNSMDKAKLIDAVARPLAQRDWQQERAVGSLLLAFPLSAI
jgi:hypothetical protein